MDEQAGRKTRLTIDLLERVVLVALYIWLCYRIIGNLDKSPLNALFMVAEGTVAVLILFRKATDQISVRARDWFIGFAGAMLPLLIMPSGGGVWSGATLLMAGMIISLWAKLNLWRSFGVVAANRGIKRAGIYGAVRHPMYLGYFLSNIGVLMLNPSWFNAGLLALWSLFQLARIQAEERVLMLDPVYQAHAEKVRYRLLPKVY